MKNLKQFIWEEMNIIQVLKAVTQWMILLTMLYCAYELHQIRLILLSL